MVSVHQSVCHFVLFCVIPYLLVSMCVSLCVILCLILVLIMCHFCLILCHSLSHSLSHSVFQDPTLFPGTLRSNLDPSGMLTDEQLWGTLDQVGLRDRVAGIRGGLSVDVGKDATLFSLGQRQLLYLARALVRRTKLLVFDEATESIEHG